VDFQECSHFSGNCHIYYLLRSKHTPSTCQRSGACTHCNTQQCTATHHNRDALQRTAMHCIAVQRTATHYNVLQHTATHCNTLPQTHLLATRKGHWQVHVNIRNCFYIYIYRPINVYIYIWNHVFCIHTFHLCIYRHICIWNHVCVNI